MTRFVRPAIALAATALMATPYSVRAVPLPHLRLTHASPAADSSVTQAPKNLTLWFSEAPELPMSKVTVANEAGTEIALGKLAAGKEGGEPSLSAPVTGAMKAGKYTVTWRAGSKDGHPMHGTYSFTVSK